MKLPMSLAVPVLLLMITAVGGCHARPRELPGMVPEPARAREALDLALRGWAERGERHGQLGPGRVELVDRRAAEGRRPKSFAILGSVREDWARGFVVRLNWEGRGDETATYVVAGSDPLWVMRRDDIDLVMHWEHSPDDPNAPAASSVTEGAEAASEPAP